MTVSSTENRKQYAGDGVTTSFATSPVAFFTGGDLNVYVVNNTTSVATNLTLNTHYTVSGGAGAVGTVNLAAGSSPYGAPATGTTLVIVRGLAITQAVDFVNNDSSDAEVAEDALDRLTMIAQQLDARIARSFVLADSDTSGASTTLPTPKATALLGWDGTGTALQNYTTSALGVALTTAYTLTLLDDAGAPAARGTLGFPAIAAKGDAILGSAADTLVKKAAPANGYIRMADSAQSDGWRDVPYTLGMKNRIINGDMRIDQRNAGAAKSVNTAAVNYGVDRWAGLGVTAAGVFSMQQTAATPPQGFSHYLRITTTTADAAPAAGSSYLLLQRIEGYNIVDLFFGNVGASSITISFRVRSSLTGTFSGAVKNGGANRTYPFTFTINAANTWETKTVTITGDTAGVWPTDNSNGMQLLIDLGSGSSFESAAGAWAAGDFSRSAGSVKLISTLNATLDVGGVQLEAGSVATAFERRSIQHELELCQRYYETSYSVGVAPGTADTNGEWGCFALNANDMYTRGNTRFKGDKRVAPTVTIYSPATGTASVYRNDGGPNDITATVERLSSGGFQLRSAAGAQTVNNYEHWHFSADAEL